MYGTSVEKHRIVLSMELLKVFFLGVGGDSLQIGKEPAI